MDAESSRPPAAGSVAVATPAAGSVAVAIPPTAAVNLAAFVAPPQASAEAGESLTLHLLGIDEKLDQRKVQRALKEAGVAYEKVTKPFNVATAKVRFASLDHKALALQALALGKFDSLGTNVRAKPSGAPTRPPREGSDDKKRPAPSDGPADESDAQPPAKRPKFNSNPPPLKSAAEAIAPWHLVPYAEQKERKIGHVQEVLRGIVAETSKTSTHRMPAWLERIKTNQRALHIAFDKAKAEQDSAARSAVEASGPEAMAVEGPEGPAMGAMAVDSPGALPALVRPRRALCCEFGGLLTAEPVNGYRNKVELTFGYDAQGQAVAGFSVGRQREQNFVVAEPEDATCLNIPQAFLDIRRDLLMEILRSPHLSTLPVPSAPTPEPGTTPAVRRLVPYQKDTRVGFWRLAMLRLNRQGQVMLVLQVNPRDLSVEELKGALERVAVFIVQAQSPTRHNIVSLYVQYWDGVSEIAPSGEERYALLWGAPHIQETLHISHKPFTFKLSPASFFQVNSAGAEVVYQTARDWALAPGGGESASELVVLDVCCGTGTIGICVAGSAPPGDDPQAPPLRVVGIEMVPEAIADAKINAEANNIAGAEWMVGKVEDKIGQVLASALHTSHAPHSAPQVVAIVDPPRSGLHKKVLQALRSCAAISRVVYVSCNQEALVRDAAALCRGVSKSTVGTEFEPIRAVGVDLFPHTPHCEVIMLFERKPRPEDFPKGLRSNAPATATESEAPPGVTSASALSDIPQ